MTLYFPSHSITIRRNRSLGSFNGVERFNFSATGTVAQADIQPLAVDRVQLIDGGRIGSTFQAFVDASVDIKEGDQIVSGGYTYSVKGMSKFQGAGLLDHHELILMRESGSN